MFYSPDLFSKSVAHYNFLNQSNYGWSILLFAVTNLPSHTSILHILLSVILLTACNKPGADEAVPLEAIDGRQQWVLPKFLREASGLALLNDDYAIAHNDEKGNLYRITLADKSIRKLASIGKPPVRKDFEGVAVAGEHVYLVTSEGEIAQLQLPDVETPKQIVSATFTATNLGQQCEIEGLHYTDNRLLLPCKKPIAPEHEGKLVVFYYDPVSGETGVQFSIKQDDIPGLKKLRLTAIDASSTDYYLVSANRLVLVNRHSLATRVFKLRKKYHDQIEGLALLPSGSILLVEDNSKGRARMTEYDDIERLEEK